MTVRILTGDCLDVLPTLDAESVDAIVCDPPYGIGFMGKGWDTFSPGAVTANMARDTRSQKRRKLYGGKESDAPSAAMAAARYDSRRDDDFEAFMYAACVAAWRVAKPGAHLVAFGSPRRHHRLMCAIEDAGWELRDCLSWLFGSGFPKSHNGPWGGTTLKPAWEPIILARKPLVGTVAANVTEHGTGALNIDGCRIEVADAAYAKNCSGDRGHADNRSRDLAFGMGCGKASAGGRWPANVVLDEDAAAALGAQTGELTSGMPGVHRLGANTGAALGRESRAPGTPMSGHGDTGGASRFFYTAKASASERNAGLTGMPTKLGGMVSNTSGQHITRRDGGAPGPRANHHPTVKPLALMRWLCRLVTPPGGLILDPFTGSGSTGCAAVAERFGFLGIELHEEYAAIARARIAHHESLIVPDLFSDGAA